MGQRVQGGDETQEDDGTETETRRVGHIVSAAVLWNSESINYRNKLTYFLNEIFERHFEMSF